MQPEMNEVDRLTVLRQNLMEQFNALQTQLRNLANAIMMVDQQVQKVTTDYEVRLKKPETSLG